MNKFPILKYDKIDDSKYIDKIKFSYQQLNHMRGELEELDIALDNNDDDNILEECLDIIQIALSIILRFNKKRINKAFLFHNEKLTRRKWNFNKFIYLFVDK